MSIINEQIIKEIKTVISHRLKQAIKFLRKYLENGLAMPVYKRKMVYSLVLEYIIPHTSKNRRSKFRI